MDDYNYPQNDKLVCVYK